MPSLAHAFVRFAVLLPAIFFGIEPDSMADQPITRLPAGVTVADSDQAEWNRVVLVATPRIASGDVNALGDSIRASVSKLLLTIMAQVRRDPKHQYVLEDVGLGYSTSIRSTLTVIDSDHASELGANLGFVGRRMLSTNESQLEKVRVVVRTTTLLMFDTPAIFHRSGKHQDYIARHLIWVDPKTGKLAMANWLLLGPGPQVFTDEPLRLIASGTREDRTIHVDGDEFFLGLPTAKAFALEKLPPGQKVGWTETLRKLARLNRYDMNRLTQLTTGINEASHLVQRTNP